MDFTIDNRDIITRVSKELSSQEQSSQEPGHRAIAAAIGTDENHSKTWREDPIVE